MIANRVYLLAIMAAIVFATPLPAQTDAINKRAAVLIKARKTSGGISLPRVVNLILNEQGPSLVCLAVGILTETDRAASEYVQVLFAASNRPDCFHQIVAQVVLANQGRAAAEIILQDSRKKENALLAANILAVHSQIEMMSGTGKPRKKNQGKKKKSGPTGSVGELIKKLFQSKDRKVLELAFLAAAYSGSNVDSEIDGLELRRAPAAEAARLLYLAKRGKPLSETVVQELTKARYKSDKRFETVTPTLSTYDPTSHPLSYLAQALAAAGNTSHMEFLYAGLENKDIRVQSDCATAIEALGVPASVEALQKVLPTCAWPTKIRVCSALGAIPDKSSVPVLLNQLDNETGRFRLDCAYALASIMGEDKSEDAAGWRRAWQEMESDFTVDAARTSAFRKDYRITDVYVRSLGSFYRHGIYSDSFVYVVDTSASMKGEKIKDLEFNLADSASSLRDPAKFNILTFGGAIKIFSNRMQTAAQGDIISDMLYGLKLSLSTRTHDAIQMATLFGEADTIYFLSDGAPVSGAFGKWHTIIPAYQYFHRYRPIAMFMVQFNAGEKNAQMMKLFAERNYGESGGTREADE